MGFNRIEVMKDMGQYVLYKSVEVRNGQLFMKMKKMAKTAEPDLF